jgi:general secretion pathway protein J
VTTACRELREPRASRGMSLIELLVTMLVLSLITVLGWRALNGILASRDALTAQLDTMRGHQLAFAQMEADCAQLLGSTAVDGQPTISVAQGRLVLLRSVAGDSGADQMQVVLYHGDGAQLVRSTSLATRDLAQLRMAWQAAVSGVTPQNGVALDRQVAAFELQTWNGGAWQTAGATTAGASAGVKRLRTRRVVRPPTTDARGLQVILRPTGGIGPLARMFLLGGG